MKELKLQKCLRKYNPKTIEQLMERFGITEKEFQADIRFQHMLKKDMDDEQYIGELKATIGELVNDNTRLKKKVNALLASALARKGMVPQK